MECAWRSHTLRVTGDWTWRYLFLAPTYTLWLDQKELDVRGGPGTRPVLEALVELEAPKTEHAPEEPADPEATVSSQDAPEEEKKADEDDAHHVEARLTSLLGFRPACDVYVDGKKIASGKVRVDNFLNPFLILFILCCSSIMVYLGPEALRRLLPNSW